MDSSQTFALVLYAIVGLFLLVTILSGFFQVRTAEAVVVQRMGKFLRVGNAGINFKLHGWTRSREESICASSSWPWTWKRKPKTTFS
jgi:hypothetical protein